MSNEIKFAIMNSFIHDHPWQERLSCFDCNVKKKFASRFRSRFSYRSSSRLFGLLIYVLFSAEIKFFVNLRHFVLNIAKCTAKNIKK